MFENTTNSPLLELIRTDSHTRESIQVHFIGSCLYRTWWREDAYKAVRHTDNHWYIEDKSKFGFLIVSASNQIRKDWGIIQHQYSTYNLKESVQTMNESSTFKNSAYGSRPVTLTSSKDMPKDETLNKTSVRTVPSINKTTFIVRLSLQQKAEIHSAVVEALYNLKELSPSNVDTAMSGRISDIEDLIDVSILEYTQIT